MSSPRGSGNFKNIRKNAREQRLQFMNSQAALIAQKKKEIEEKLAQQQQQQQPKEVKVEPKVEAQEAIIRTIEEALPTPLKTPAVLPFKNDGSFLEQFRQMQQQSAKHVELNSPATQHFQTDYNNPPSIDVSIPPPSMQHSMQTSSYYTQHPPPSYHSAPPPIKIKEEVKEEKRSPSPYSPSRPCEDDDDLTYYNTKDYHQKPGPSNSSEDSGNFSQSGLDFKRKFKEEADDSENSKMKERERKRQSRWGPQEVKTEPAVLAVNSLPLCAPNVGYAGSSTNNQSVLARSSVLSRITSADPQILTYAVKVFGTTDLTEDQWKQCMDQVKMQYVYQEMLRKKQERDRLAMVGKVRYEYDSDEETEGGTWEHKRRLAEMEKTKEWADQLTELGRGKHHLGHFLPPEELAKFMEKFQAVQEGRTIDESDYKEFKIAENNVGYQMLKKFGWTEGEGLGIGGSGITAPVNATRRNEAQGLGATKPEDLTSQDDEYDAYRKRMMLAYRFRPNPLNNPRRAYY